MGISFSLPLKEITGKPFILFFNMSYCLRFPKKSGCSGSKTEDAVDEWARSLNCPMIQVDGTKPVKETVDMIANDFLSPIQKGSAVIK